MAASEFVRRLKDQTGEPDRHYVLWLGAGCSVTSGIPAASTLVRDHWLPRLHRVQGGDKPFDEWVAQLLPGYDSEKASAHYGTVMDQLFLHPEDRQRETERLCTGHEPGFGYAVLAALMSREDGILGTALTTNFDDMVADAMYVFGTRRPLVIEHDALADFVRAGRVRRPLVVKVHGDHRLNPKHTDDETGALTDGVAVGIRGLMQDRGVIFIGYSGNDHGVLHTLEALGPGALPHGVWWVSATEPTGLMKDWLVRRNAIWVRSPGFDELMLLFHEEFGIDHPTVKRFEAMVSNYRQTYERLNARVADLPDTEADTAPLKQAAQRAAEVADDWWAVELAAQRYTNSDPATADRIYSEGVAHLENADLLGNYANFLRNLGTDNDRADAMYQRAIHADPHHAMNLTNYATFLAYTRDDFERADQLLEQATEADPTSPFAAAQQALLRWRHRGDTERATSRAVLQRAAATSTDPWVQGTYALFLAESGDAADRELAHDIYTASLSTDPTRANTWGNLARLQVERRDDDGARASIAAVRANAPSQSAVLLEVLLYELVLSPEPRSTRVAQIHELIDAGVRSPSWNFGLVLDRARADGHPDIEWLERLAAVIADGEDPAVLEGWADWPSPSSDES